jgi:hypothetical protein
MKCIHLNPITGHTDCPDRTVIWKINRNEERRQSISEQAALSCYSRDVDVDVDADDECGWRSDTLSGTFTCPHSLTHGDTFSRHALGGVFLPDN